MTRGILSQAVALLLLTGCTQLAGYASKDAGTAAAMAAAAAQSGDAGAAARAQCYTGWSGLATGIAASSKMGSLGIFTGVETGIEASNLVRTPGCQAITAQILMYAIQHSPAGMFLPF